MKNNKGVTLVELIIVIVIIGIISAFTVPAVGRYLENAQKSAVLEDARQIRNASDNYCAEQGGCAVGITYFWVDVTTDLGADSATVKDLSGEELVSNFGGATDYNQVSAVKTTTGWNVLLVAVDSGAWEWDLGDPLNAVVDDVDAND